MAAVNLALQALSGEGPRGGILNNGTQERRNAPLSAAVITTKDGERIVGMHDSRKNDAASVGLQKEQPWNRMAAHMLIRGFSNIEVADAAGVTKETVSTLRAQRWFNELCATLAEGKEGAVRKILDGYALEAVEAIHAIATDDRTDDEGKPTTPARVKLTAFTTLLEHSQGKPTQKVLSVTASTSFSSERDEYNSIMEELKGIAPLVQQNNPSQ